MAVGAKLKNLQVEQATTNLLKSEAGGKILSSIDMHGKSLCLKVI